jgi:SAM-dependent methyltransferase
MPATPAPDDQGRQWSRHASRYDEVFLDPFREGVHNPVVAAIAARTFEPDAAAIDLGCGTGPLLPLLRSKFGHVTALDFAPGMIKHARARLGDDADAVTFLTRPMHDLDDLAGRLDLAVAINSIVMPDVRAIDRTLAAIRRALKPGGVFLGMVPSIDAIHYHTILLRDRALDEGKSYEEAEQFAAYHAEHPFYDFAFGRFAFRGLRQSFWQPFELEHRLRKAGFGSFALEKALYPWDDHILGGGDFTGLPPSWDWCFTARP